jgi:hypothetical protein
MKVKEELLPKQHSSSVKSFKAFCSQKSATKTFGEDRLTLLHLACTLFESVPLLDWLISTKGVWPHSITKCSKKTALHCAVRKGSLPLVKALIEKHKVNQHALRSRKENALFIAVKYNYTALAEYLLQRGIDPHLKNTSNTSLVTLAASHGNAGLLRLFKNVGVSLHTINDKGENALMLAAQSGSLECVHFLVDEGLCTVALAGSRSLLHYGEKHPEIVMWILENTAWNRLRTTQILLEIQAPQQAFGGRSLAADLVLKYDRKDLLKNIACIEENSPEKLLSRATGERTKTYLEEQCRWRRVLGSLFVRSRQVSIVSSLSANLFREVYRLL